MAKKRARMRAAAVPGGSQQHQQQQQLTQGSPKGAGRGSKMQRVDAAGAEICYKFAKGAAGACPDPCPQGRKHICQMCRGSQRNADCPQTAGRGGPL